MKLEITKEKVLEAASKCETAKATLKTLFPEVFEGERLNLSAWRGFESINKVMDVNGQPVISVNGLYGEEKNPSFILWGLDYDWSLIKIKDREHYLLTPTKK
jgi:hypothetical protein